MGYPFLLARRYLSSKKRNIISISTGLSIGGVALGVAALAIVMSVTGGFQEQFQEKVLGVNAHVLVLKYSIDFREYREVMKKVEKVKGVTGVAPFVINPMMVTHADRTATGVLLKGVDPELMPKVLDLPKHIKEGSLTGLRRVGAKPPERQVDPIRPQPSDPLFPIESDAGARAPMLGSMRTDPFDLIEDGGVPELGAPVDAGAPAPQKTAKVADAGAPAQNLPVGSIEPDGGYGSQLPEEDILNTIIDPDPCNSPEQVATLPGVVIGRSLSRQLDVKIGDCVQVTSPTIGISLGASQRPPIAKQFRVIAIFEAGFDQYDSKLVYTDLYEAQAFYEYGDSVTGVEMRVDDVDGAHDVAKEIDRVLSNGVYHTMDWRELNHGLFTALLIQKVGMSFTLGLIIFVAAFTVIATLVMVVLEKQKEIALLKAIGARNAAILRTFLYQGAIIGVAGTTLGLAFGYLCCRFLLVYSFPLDPKVYFISHLPVSLKFTDWVITGVFAVMICILATVYPAVYAARLRPADGLRSE